MQKIILASQSPRRKQLLEWAHVPFDIVVRHTNEDYPPGLSIPEVPVFIAKQKALAVHQYIDSLPNTPYAGTAILAADTVVICDETIIGKPHDKQQAIDILQMLAGRHHQVITGVVIVQGDKEIAFAETTDVIFHPLSVQQIEWYVEHYKPYDKAGAYAIQEWIGVVGIKGVQGDFYNVMGLPVSRVVQALATLA